MKNAELMGDNAAGESGAKLYGASVYKHSEIIAHTKFGVEMSINGALRSQDTTVGFGISVIPGAKSLLTYKGGSPKYFPFINPNIFSIY